MPSTNNAHKFHDYTEGASATDITEALANSRRSRRDSQYSTIYGEDAEGAMFAGPGHSVNPSSVSRMPNLDRRRSSDDRSRSRRLSSASSRRAVSRRSSKDSDSQVSQQTQDGEGDDVDSGSEAGDLGERRSLRPGPRKRKSTSRANVFNNFASFFGRNAPEAHHQRRPSISQRSSISRRSRRSDAGSDYAVDTDGDNDEERWGYTSGDDFSDMSDELDDNVSVTNSMRRDFEPGSNPGALLPLLTNDPIFGGEARIDIDIPFASLEPPPPGPPSRQTIYLADEDSNVRFIGFETPSIRHRLWHFGCFVSLGLLALLGHWFPRFWLRWVAKEKAFKDAKGGFVVIESAHGDIAMCPLRTLSYPYDISTVFPERVDLSSDGRLPDGSTPKPIAGPLGKLTVVDYRYTRFALDPRTGLFVMIKNWKDPSWTGQSSVTNGLTEPVRRQRLTLFGKNEIDIEGKSSLSLLVDEIIHPFYVFQIASIILWSLDDYYYYAFCIALISSLSIITTLIDTRKTIARMRAMSRFVCKTDVFVDGIWLEQSSSDLVPGDIVNLSRSQFHTFPADMFLLCGDAIINESMLTGESVPVSKTALKDQEIARWKDVDDVTAEMAKGFLYSGTRVIRIRGGLGDGGYTKPALAVVTRTGFNTTKGALVRSMLFPKPIGFKFYRDSMRFIGVLAGIAGLGFCASAVQFVKLGVKWHTIVIRALDLITVVVPPALPATLSIGTSFAISRLRKLGIFCIAPSRVNVAGKINVCCFDKTGTLTEDGLDILGVRGLDRNVQRFGELFEDVYDLSPSRDKASFLHAMATCHSLKMVDGEIIGDPLDVKMFEFTKWTLDEGTAAGTGVIKARSGAIIEQTSLVQTVVRPPGSGQFRLEDALRGGARHAHFLELGVIRTFEFVSSLRRMSVVVKRLKSSSMEIYVKGAPEVMSEICNPDTFPQDYGDLLSYYTKRGYRVIAIAGRSIEGLSWRKAQLMKRDQVETSLQFLGLIIFENKIKRGTAPAIQALRSAHLACRMITGDNPLTAVSVARECSLINQTANVFFPVFLMGNATTPASKLQWSCMDEPQWLLDDYSLKPLDPPPHQAVEDDNNETQDYSLAVTGDVFRWMINYAPLETLQRMLVKAQIFARMSPDEKNEIVERLQMLGYTVLMCGDGANDCAALKAADVGISLSEAEASVAAPFTSSTPDIGCVLEVIKEGRAALVTSFSCFKYMALYSLIQFTTITLLYSFASSLGDFQFLYIDLFIIIPVAVTMGRTLPYPLIHHKRPTANLVSTKVLSSIIGQIVITSAVQFWAFFWVRRQEWYSPPTTDTPTVGDKLEATNFENSALFLVSCFQYILVAAVFSIGPPYRKPMFTNGWLMLSLITLTVFNILVLLYPPQLITVVLELMPLPFVGRMDLLVSVVINVCLSMVFERWGAQGIAEVVDSLRELISHDTRRYQDGKAYRAVDMGHDG
ncbi:hypothetical protein BDN71DRAFT_1461138 [Pleurotus eryngii]|uniref:Cation-transporting ATPase n=1 Tax=Pleurotus eryngii TaxID=5323 RepID=A0A9P6ABE5_PLEER|nr:hypothetical protein BDN71DRAFT_1461138 [Pleurotus eryngii]